MMNIKNRVYVLLLCILVLSSCGNNQNTLDGDVNSTREGIEEQTGSEAETQAEAQENAADEHPAAACQEYDSASLSNSWLSIKDVDWEAYRTILSDEDYAALQSYLPVLRDEAEFTWTIGPYYYGDEADKRTVTLDEFRYILNNEFWGGGDDPDDLWLNSIALCDMDRDGNKELILRLENITGHYLILKQEAGMYYGTDKMYRAFEELQTNGIYIGSGGAATVYYYQMYFEEGEFGEVLLGYMDWGRYDIGGTEITDEEVFLEWVDGILSEDVIYYEPGRKEEDSWPGRRPSIKDVDWEAYSTILSDEDHAALQSYLPVLTEEALFTWTELARPDEDEVEKRTATLAEFGHMLNDNPGGGSCGLDEVRLDSLTLCDVDGDGNKELILYLESQEGIFLILKEEKGTYYGTYTVLRGFEALQTNGVYACSDGAADISFCRMYFEEGVFRQAVLGHAWRDRYDMGGELTTDEEVFQEWLDSIMSEDILYYKPQIKNSGSQVEYISIDIHSEEEYQELVRQLEGYPGYFSLKLYMEGSDISVYLDDIIAGRNLIYLEVENGGRIAARNVEILDTGSLRGLRLTRVLSVDEAVLRYALVLDTIEIELDDSYEGAVPTGELLENRVCPNFILSWSGSEKSGLPAGREVCNGASEEWDALAPMLESGNLVRICRLNEGDYCYTSFEFTGPESEWDCCGALVSVRDRESGGEKYFDMLEIPEERLGGIYSMRAQQIILEDANFDGYSDLIFASFYRYYTGTIFLWDQKKERYVLCESAPWAFEWIEPERKRLIYADTRRMDYEVYYIYEYNGSAFTEKKLELGFTEEEETGVKRYTWHYYEGGELLETLELVEDENIAGNYLIYEGNGATREEVLTQEKIYYKDIGMEFFPEFDFCLSG